jgi:TrmH family RNA methyltransferase
MGESLAGECLFCHDIYNNLAISRMITKELSSLQHPIVKHWVKLRSEKSYRAEQKSALIAGEKMVAEAGPLKALICTKGATLPPSSAATLYIVPPEILKKITGLENPEPYAAEVALPPPASLKGKKRLLALNGIADPGNLGTLLRTALALGWEGVFITSSSVDPFNDKALRAARGATFRLPLRCGSREELESLIQESKLHVYVADAKGKSLLEAKIQTPLLLILGSESHGPSLWAKERYPSLCIPMTGEMESLNVAIAGAILMHALRAL